MHTFYVYLLPTKLTAVYQQYSVSILFLAAALAFSALYKSTCYLLQPCLLHMFQLNCCFHQVHPVRVKHGA